MLRYTYFCYFLWFWTISFCAKLYPQSLPFNPQHLGANKGLIHDEGNYFVSENSQGFIWISSQNGFYRFDGVKLKYFLIPVPEQATFTPDQNIQSAFYEDKQNRLWFTSYNSLHCYNTSTHQFLSLQNPGSDGIEINYSYHIFHIEEKTDRLWLRAGEKVWIYDIKNNVWEAQFPTNGVRFAVICNESNEPQIVISCSWVNGPLSIAKKNGKEGWHQESFLESEYAIRNTLIKNDSIIWLFSNRGLIEFNVEKETPARIYSKTPQGIPLNLFSGHLLKDKETLLLATLDQGIITLNLNTQTFDDKSWDFHEPAINTPRAFLSSSSHQLWISYKNDGLIYTFSSSSAFKNYADFQDKPIQQVNFLVEDHDKNIWQLTEKGELFVFDKKKKFQSRINLPSHQSAFRHMGLDHSGDLWFVTDSDVFQLLKRTSPSSILWKKILTTEKRVVSIFTGINGRILLNTQEGIFDIVSEGEHVKLEFSEEFAKYPGFNFTYLYTLDSSHFFVPFESKELWLFERDVHEWKLQKQLGIGGHTYSGLIPTSSDSIWIGTTLGLFLYNNEKLEKHLDDYEELAGVSIYGVQPDSKNNLWLSTPSGLKKYHLPSKKLIHFSEADGLASNQFSHYAYLKASDGKIWLGNKKGLTVFHPDSVQANLLPAKVHIEAFWVNNLPVEMDSSISYKKSLSLDYLQNTLAFELIAVGFQEAQKNRLRYRLAGYDENWVTIPNGSFARFTKIPPGDYVLEVVAINANNVEGPTTYLPIEIKPPFWQRLWFRVMAIFSALFLVTLIFRFYYGYKLRKQRQLLEKEQTLNEERNRIAKELHDDMGSSLSSILFLSEDLLFESPDENKHEIERISSLAENSLENMREIIWALDKDKNTLNDLLIHFRAFATQLLADHKVSLEFELGQVSKQTYMLGSEYRRNVYLILKEALHNVIKHAEASQVHIRVAVEESQLFISVKDDGKGFDVDAANPEGYGLNTMKSRATDIKADLKIESKSGQGTVLTLKVPL